MHFATPSIRSRLGAASTPRSATLVSVLLLFVFAFTPGAAYADRFDDLLQQASKARKAGDLKTTATLLRQAIAIQPLPPLLNNLGKILEELGDYQGAVDTYKKVTNNPKADANLRSLDAARIATLQVKLGKGWVLVAANAPYTARVNGRPPAAPAGKEFPVAPGMTHLEFATPGGEILTSLSRSFPLGRRTTLKVPVSGELEGPWGAVDWTDLAEAPTAVKVDGYRVVVSDALTELRLAAGQRTLRLSFGQQAVALKVDVAAGQKASIATQLQASLAAVRSKAAEVGDAAEAVSPWPFVLMGAGLVGAGVGAYLVVAAEDARAEVLNAEVDSQGVITSLTLADAVEIEEDADFDATTGAVLLGVGGALVVGGVLWMALDLASDKADGKRSVDVSFGIGSVGLSGRF